MTVKNGLSVLFHTFNPPADFRLPKRSQERFGLENKVVSAKISAEIREDNSSKGPGLPGKHQSRIDPDSFA